MAKGANKITARMSQVGWSSVVAVSLSADLRGEKKNWRWMTTTMMILLNFDLTRQAWTLSTCHALYDQELSESSMHDSVADATVIGAVAPAAAAAALVVVADEVVAAAECFGCEE